MVDPIKHEVDVMQRLVKSVLFFVFVRKIKVESREEWEFGENDFAVYLVRSLFKHQM